MRAPARWPSGMLTRSTPPIFSRRARSTTSFGLIAARRQQLDRDDERAAGHRVGEPGLLVTRNGRCADARRRSRAEAFARRRVGWPSAPAAGRARAHRRLHLPDVLGRRPAAAADQPHVVLNEATRVRRHVFRRAEIDVAPLDVARLSGVGLGRERARGDGGHPFDGVEHRRRADRAVQPDDGRAARFQIRREALGRRAVQRVAVLLGGHLRDDRPIGHAPHRVDRGADLVQVAERLEDEQIDAAIGQRLRLLAEIVARLVDAGLAPRFDAHAERSDRAGDVGLLARGLARDLRALRVDLVQPVGQAERSEPDPVRAERVGLDHVGAGAHVFLVYLGDQLRLREVQGVEALVDEDALGVQHRPHRAVADEHALVERLKKRRQQSTYPAAPS